jgi:hypothetical protein
VTERGLSERVGAILAVKKDAEKHACASMFSHIASETEPIRKPAVPISECLRATVSPRGAAMCRSWRYGGDFLVDEKQGGGWPIALVIDHRDGAACSFASHQRPAR